jgi:peptide/nickel transport system permease protein
MSALSPQAVPAETAAGRMPGAAWWLARRLVSGIWVLFGAATVSFAALHLLPGDPVATVLGGEPATPAVVQQVRADLGVGQPWPREYLQFLGHLATGDLGYSYQLNEPVSQAVGSQLGATVTLAAAAAALGVFGALATSLATAGPGRRVRRFLVGAVELVAISTPTFWSAILLLTLFSFQLRLFPVVGAGGLQSLVLPAVTLAFPIAAVLGRVMREEMDHALTQPFVVTARAHGLREGTIRSRHALRHAALPAVTLSGWIIGSLLSGAVLVETVFGRPGIGQVAQNAISDGDLPVVVGVVLLSAAVFVVLNIAVDVLYLVIDPRLRAA